MLRGLWRQFDKWTTEGKVKSIFAKYLKRLPALKAENVLAFSYEWIILINKGGTADYHSLSFNKGRLFLFV